VSIPLLYDAPTLFCNESIVGTAKPICPHAPWTVEPMYPHASWMAGVWGEASPPVPPEVRPNVGPAVRVRETS